MTAILPPPGGSLIRLDVAAADACGPDGCCGTNPVALGESGQPVLVDASADAAPHDESGSCCATDTPGDGHHGYHATKKAHLLRLRRIEGQIRGLQKMVEEDKYCIDILTQVSAATKALQSVALVLLDEHLNHCVRNAAETGGPEADQKLAEASQAIARLVRS